MTADGTAKFDTHDMVLVHRAFRRELRLIPGLVRGVADGDTVRAEQVGAHTAVILSFLEVHHQGEDELLWPLLLDRAPSAAGIVERMQGAHHTVHAQLATSDALLVTWRASASRADGDALADAITALGATLVAHLDDEELTVLPLTIEHLNAEEWAALGEHGFGHVEPQDRLAVLGGILEDADDAEREAFLGNIAPMAGEMWRGGGSEAYAGYTAAVRGTA